MNVLAIDTSTDRLSIAAARSDGRRVEREATGARRHAALLGPLVLDALGELDLGLDRLDRILLADGPGSFTGIRVGAAFVKGITAGLPIPVRVASTLLVRAARATPPSGGRPVAALGVGFALRGELFAGGYHLSADEVVAAFAPTVIAAGGPLPGAFTPDRIVGDLPPDALAGWSWARGTAVIGPPDGLPAAGRLLDLDRMRGGTRRVHDLDAWEPIYGRPAEAQVRWEQKHGRPLADSTRGAD